MNATEVERLVRDVIVHGGLPFTVLSVSSSPPGWTITVRSETGDVVQFPLADGRPVDMRITIQDTLEGQS
jgi:hypothetical protein